MKKVLLALALCISLQACEPPTIEEKIETAFKQYVEENFNDPSDLENIISITPNDTMTVETIGEIKLALDKLHECILESDSLCKKNMDILQKKLTPSVIGKYYGDERILSLIGEQMKVTNKRLDWMYSNEDSFFYLMHKLDTCYNSLDSSLFKVTYEIKTRVNGRGELQIKPYYAIVDGEVIEIYSKYPSFNDYSPQIEQFFEYVEEYQPLLEQLSEYSTNEFLLSRRLLKALHIEN